MKRESGMGDLTLWQKQAVIVTLLSLPIIVLLYLTIQEKNKEIELARNEASGIVYLSALRMLMDKVRIVSLTWNRNAFLLGGLLVALLVGLVLFTLARGLARQLNSLTRLVAEINAGNEFECACRGADQ